MCSFGPFLERTCQFGPVDWNLFPVGSTFTFGAQDQPFPGCCTVSFLRLICMAIGDMLSIFWTSLRHAALYLCWRQGWLYLYWYPQLSWTKPIVAYEYCWYYGVLGDRTVFLIDVMCWFFCRSWDVSCTCTALSCWCDLDRDTAVVTDLRQGIDCLGRIRWYMCVQ